MIKIKNNGKKIVHIGNTALMPGDEITVNEKVGKTPAIYALAKNKILTITDTELTGQAEAATGDEKAAGTDNIDDTGDTNKASSDETAAKKTTVRKNATTKK